MRTNTESTCRENLRYPHFPFCLPNNPELTLFSLGLLTDPSKRSLTVPILQHGLRNKPILAYGNETHH